jgi:hypothetical protein
LLPNPLQNAQEHQHTRTCKIKNKIVCIFHYPLSPMCEILDTSQIDGNYPFSQYFHTQAKIHISNFERFLKNWRYIVFWNFKFFEPWWKYIYIYIYILSLSSKLRKAHMFFKQTPRNKKTNAFSTCAIHLCFVNINIQFIFRPICGCNILHVIHDKNR